MKTEISRDSHQPEKRYSGVYQQQGRMLTDADWNELVEILKDRLKVALKDVVGSKESSFGGTPRHRALNVIKTTDTDPLTIEQGQIYVDGYQAEAKPDPLEYPTETPPPETFDYNKQLDFPSPPTLPANGVVYVDVWERTVTHLMDERLRDKGLHGADTCTRKQTMCQVKWCPVIVDPEKAAENPAKGNAELTVTLLQKSTQPDSCDPCAAQLDVESKVGNYLFRVEVHDVKKDANDPSEITLKWSSENAAEQYALKNATGDDVEPPAEFKSGQWTYEFFDETSERHLGVHLEKLVDWQPVRDVLRSEYNKPVDEPNRFVRRWDGYCKLEKNSTNWEVAEQFDRNQSGSGSASFTEIADDKLTVNLDAQTLTLTLNSSFAAGDYWLAEVREAEHEAGDPLMTDETPHGIEHHYLTLGKVEGGVLQPNPEADRKYAFPPLTEMTRMFHVGGDGQEAMPEHGLPHPLQAGVGNGEWPVEGAKVRFEVENPDGVDPNDLGSLDPPTPAIITTDENGLAACAWTLGATGKQRVKVTLLDPDDPSDSTDLDHSPIYFNANLSVASNVFYDASEKADRWRDINEEEEGEVLPSTVQEAIDDLADNLQSEDIKYTPSCPGDIPPTVRSQLEIPADTSSRVHEVLDKLLCDFNATHLPIDKDDEKLCGRLKAEGIETVQDALDTLCRMEQGGGGCAVTVGENGGQHPTLKDAFDALAAEDEISLCLMPGNHQVDPGLVVSDKRSIKISGAGSQGSVIEAQGNIKLAADEIQLKDLGVDVTSFEYGISLKGDSIGADGCVFTRTDLPENIHLWSKNYKSTGREYGQGVAVDPEGNMLVTGYFTGKVDFGGKILTAVGEDLFVVKLSPEGKLVWVHNYSSTSNEHGLGIAVDPEGYVLVTGHFDGEVTFGSQTLKAEGTDLFVLKLEPKAGTAIWARNFKSSSSEEGHGVAVDGQGNVLLTGYFEGVMDADGKWLTANGTDLFVIKLEPEEGKVIWAHNYKSEGNEHGMSVAVDPEGYVFLTGYFDGAVAFGEFKLSAKGTDLFVLKLEPKAGNVLWAHNYISEGNEHGMGIAVDPKGSVILTGYFDGKVSFGEFELSAEGTDMFVVKLEPKAGKVLWANNYSRIGVDYGMAVAVDAGGNVFVTGYFNTKTVFGDWRMKSSGEDMFVLKLDPEGKEIWVKQFGGAGNQRGLGIAVHPKGYVHVTGYFSGRAEFGDHKLIAMGVDLFALMLEPQKGDVVWVRNFANVSHEGAMAVAVDRDGNVLVTGSFNGSVDFGGHILEATKTDVYVLKLDTDGKAIWAKNYQGTSGESGSGIAVDVEGNVLLTGWFDGAVNFDGHKLKSVGINDLFILKLNPSGEVMWAKNYQGPSSDVGSGIAVDADGNVLVTGRFVEALDFDGHKLVSKGHSDLFVLKLSPMGKVLWAKDSKGDGAIMGSGIAVDAVGNVLITGNFDGEVTFGQYKFKSVFIDLFALKLSPDGEVIWARSFGNKGLDSGHDIAVDKIGNVIVTGQFNGTVGFDDFRLTSDGIDLFVLKLEQKEGHVLWARNYQGTGVEMGHGVTVDTSGHVLVTGQFNSELDFDGRPLVSVGTDLFVLKLSDEGRVVWAHNFISTGSEYGYGIAADRKGNVLVTGLFDGRVDFGGGVLTSVGLDLFITKLAIPAAAPPLVEVLSAKDKQEAVLNWNRNTMHMPSAGDAIANPGLRLDGLFDALTLGDSQVGGWISGNQIMGQVVLLERLPGDLKSPLPVEHGVLHIGGGGAELTLRDNRIYRLSSHYEGGAPDMDAYSSIVLTDNVFREIGNSFIASSLSMSGNQFPAETENDVVALAVAERATIFGNQAGHPDAILQVIIPTYREAANLLRIQQSNLAYYYPGYGYGFSEGIGADLL
jgi:hypothetical protein